MVHDFSFSCVLLTYKGKILLLSPDLDPNSLEQRSWCLIGGENVDAESFEQTIYRKIKYTTKLELKNIHLLSSSLHKNHDKYFYHGELTDNDVNLMERREGQRLEFFTLVELKKLSLTGATELFLAEYKNAVEELLARE